VAALALPFPSRAGAPPLTPAKISSRLPVGRPVKSRFYPTVLSKSRVPRKGKPLRQSSACAPHCAPLPPTIRGVPRDSRNASLRKGSPVLLRVKQEFTLEARRVHFSVVLTDSRMATLTCRPRLRTGIQSRKPGIQRSHNPLLHRKNYRLHLLLKPFHLPPVMCIKD
jgi:hypothetical protein